MRLHSACVNALAAAVTAVLAGCTSVPPAVAETCVVNRQAWPLCARGDGWGFEDGRYCIARSFCPDRRTSLPAGPGRVAPVDLQAGRGARDLYAYLRGISGDSSCTASQT